MPETNNNSAVSPVESLIADCRLSRKRLGAEPLADAEAMTKELRNNVYPMFVAVLEQIAEVDDVIQEVVEQQESFIEPELAEQILTTLAAGGALVEEVKTLLDDMDELRRKKFQKIIEAFVHAAELTYMGVSDAADMRQLGDDDDDDDGDDDDEDKPDEPEGDVVIDDLPEDKDE